jgi:hypothetical protein
MSDGEVMLRCLTCPMCDQPPALAVDPRQVFCGNEDCPAFCWDMTETREHNRTHITVHDVSDFGRNSQPPDS